MICNFKTYLIYIFIPLGTHPPPIHRLLHAHPAPPPRHSDFFFHFHHKEHFHILSNWSFCPRTRWLWLHAVSGFEQQRRRLCRGRQWQNIYPFVCHRFNFIENVQWHKSMFEHQPPPVRVCECVLGEVRLGGRGVVVTQERRIFEIYGWKALTLFANGKCKAAGRLGVGGGRGWTERATMQARREWDRSGDVTNLLNQHWLRITNNSNDIVANGGIPFRWFFCRSEKKGKIKFQSYQLVLLLLGFRVRW